MYGFCHVNRYRQANPHISTRADYGSIDTDGLAVKIQQRTARVAEVNRRIGLDEILVARNADIAAALRTHDTSSHRVAQSKGIADGDYPFADLQGIGIGQFENGQVLGINFDYGNLGLGVRPDQLGGELAIVREVYCDFLGLTDQMIVRQDVAIG